MGEVKTATRMRNEVTTATRMRSSLLSHRHSRNLIVVITVVNSEWRQRHNATSGQDRKIIASVLLFYYPLFFVRRQIQTPICVSLYPPPLWASRCSQKEHNVWQTLKDSCEPKQLPSKRATNTKIGRQRNWHDVVRKNCTAAGKKRTGSICWVKET
jgi:hypothetical protein